MCGIHHWRVVVVFAHLPMIAWICHLLVAWQWYVCMCVHLQTWFLAYPSVHGSGVGCSLVDLDITERSHSWRCVHIDFICMARLRSIFYDVCDCSCLTLTLCETRSTSQNLCSVSSSSVWWLCTSVHSALFEAVWPYLSAPSRVVVVVWCAHSGLDVRFQLLETVLPSMNGLLLPSLSALRMSNQLTLLSVQSCTCMRCSPFIVCCAIVCIAVDVGARSSSDW